MWYREIIGVHHKLTPCIQGLHNRIAAGEACNID
jgi:hypothetical protein